MAASCMAWHGIGKVGRVKAMHRTGTVNKGGGHLKISYPKRVSPVNYRLLPEVSNGVEPQLESATEKFTVALAVTKPQLQPLPAASGNVFPRFRLIRPWLLAASDLESRSA